MDPGWLQATSFGRNDSLIPCDDVVDVKHVINTKSNKKEETNKGDGDEVILSPASSKTAQDVSCDKQCITSAKKEAKVSLEAAQGSKVESGGSSRSPEDKTIAGGTSKRKVSPEAQEEKRCAVLKFIRPRLESWYSTGIITKEIYKTAAKKVVTEVCSVHSEHQTASFLIDEGNSILDYTKKTIKHLLDEAAERKCAKEEVKRKRLEEGVKEERLKEEAKRK